METLVLFVVKNLYLFLLLSGNSGNSLSTMNCKHMGYQVIIEKQFARKKMKNVNNLISME